MPDKQKGFVAYIRFLKDSAIVGGVLCQIPALNEREAEKRAGQMVDICKDLRKDIDAAEVASIFETTRELWVPSYNGTPFVDRHTEEVECSIRVYSGLKNGGIRSVRELCQLTKKELKQKIRSNFGAKSLKEVCDMLGEHGLRLGMSEDEVEVISRMQR